MTILEFVARTFSPQLADGRFIFRPWGAKGPCFLLSPRQRVVRAAIQLFFYAVMVGAIGLVPEITETGEGIVSYFFGFVLLNYFLYWLFSIGLPQTAPPQPLTPAQRRAALGAHSRGLGRPLLWILTIVSLLFALCGAAMVLLLSQWFEGLFCLVVFGTCAVIFIRRLQLAGSGGR